jgi:DNA-binding GntR family transcriptional regulator
MPTLRMQESNGVPGEHLRFRHAIGSRDAERAREEMRAHFEGVESHIQHVRVGALHG